MGSGESYMPAATAEVEVMIPSLQNSMKMAAPLRPLGSLTQDRQSGIALDTTKTTPMIPVDIKIKTGEGEQSFHSEVVSHRFLTPQLASMALAQALTLMAPDMTDVTITVHSTVQIKGYEPLSFTDYMYSAEGMSANTLTSVRGLRLLVPLMFNPFKPVKLEHVELSADISYKADFADIQSLRLPEVEIPVDKDTWVDVQLRPYNGKSYVQRVPLHIPRRLAGATVKLEIVPGDQAKADAATPENLDEVMDVLRNKTFPANVLVATVYTPEEGVTMDGKVIPDLPDSAIDTVRPAAATKRSDSYRSILRAVAPVKQVVQGRQELVVKIADLK
jgi:hypothetical protein